MARRQQRGLGSGIEAAKNVARQECPRPQFPTRVFWHLPPGGIWDFLSGVNCARIDAGTEARSLRVECTSGGIASCRSEEHTSELQSRENLVCRLLLEKKKKKKNKKKNET